MKKTLSIIITGAIIGMAVTAEAAKREDKNDPKKSYVEDTLKALGEEHFPEKMKVRKVGSVKTDSTYYHVFCGALKGGYNYRVIVFDNKQQYIGYYELEYDVSGYEDGAVLINIAASDPAKIRIEDKGPVDNTRIDGVSVKLKKAPEPEKKKSVEANGGANAGKAPEFREWIVTHKGKKIPVRAIYVSQTFGKVTLRAEASGRESTFAISSLSDADKAYIKQYQ